MDERSSTAQNVRRFENPDEAYIEKLESRIAELEGLIRQEMTFISSRLEGTTHYEGCEADHPMCAAYRRMETALRGEGE